MLELAASAEIAIPRTARRRGYVAAPQTIESELAIFRAVADDLTHIDDPARMPGDKAGPMPRAKPCSGTSA
jgi:hypothetical protein